MQERSEQIVKYNNCDYRCYIKQVRGRTVYDRVFCGKVDPKCGRVVRSKKPITDIKVLIADMHLMIADSREGKTQTSLLHIFKDYAPFEVGQALLSLVKDEKIARLKSKTGIEDRYVSVDPSISAEPATNIAKAQEIVSIIEPFPSPLTVAQTFSTKHFHAYKGVQEGMSSRVIVGDKYIGVASTAVLKTFRPKLAEQLMKLSKKWGDRSKGIGQQYDKIIEDISTDIEWKLVGIIPLAKGTKTSLGVSYGDTAILISCKTGQVTQVNGRWIHIVEDACDNVRYYSSGMEYAMVAECNDKKVMMTMPLKMPLLKGIREAMTELLC